MFQTCFISNQIYLWYTFSQMLLDGSHISDQWNIIFYVKYIGDVNSYWVTFDCLFLNISSQFIVIFIFFTTANYTFGSGPHRCSAQTIPSVLVHIDAVRKNKNKIFEKLTNRHCLWNNLCKIFKNWRIATAYEIIYEKSLKNWRIIAAYENICKYCNATHIFK